jgi:hypothetical protein
MEKTKPAPEGTRIVQRGLVLLLVTSALAVSVLMIMLRRHTPVEQTSDNSPRTAVAAIAVASTAFPANIPWGAVYQAGDTMPSAPGWEIRYTASRVLASRGSAKVPLPVLCEMLDENRQLRNFQAKLADGRIVSDEGAAAQEVVIALRAVSEWHKHSDAVQAVGPAGLQKLAAAVQKLTHSGNNVIRTHAHETLLELNKS